MKVINHNGEYFAHTNGDLGFYVWSRYDAEKLAEELGEELICGYEEWEPRKYRKPAQCLVKYEELDND